MFFLAAFIVLFFDQFSKYLVLQRMDFQETFPVIENIFHITLITNPGAAFGMMEHRIAFFVAITLVVVAVIVAFLLYLPAENKMLKIGLALQLGGAMGNLVDRLRFGYVVDFFDFLIWPIFNIADIAIVVGLFFIGYDMIFKNPQKKPT